MKKHSHPRMHDEEAPEDLPLFRCDAATPAAPDGADWEAQVIRLALEMCPAGISLTPSALRRAAEQVGLHPPIERAQHAWGILWAKLRRWFERTDHTTVSATASRNAVREVIYVRRRA